MPTFVIAQEDDVTLSGTYQGTFGQAKVSGTLDGIRIAFWFETQRIKATYTGTIADNTMSGTCATTETSARGSGRGRGSRRGRNEIGVRREPEGFANS